MRLGLTDAFGDQSLRPLAQGWRDKLSFHFALRCKGSAECVTGGGGDLWTAHEHGRPYAVRSGGLESQNPPAQVCDGDVHGGLQV